MITYHHQLSFQFVNKCTQMCSLLQRMWWHNDAYFCNIGGYSDMDGLQLTCEFTFNKKETKQKENFVAAVFEVLYCPENVLFSATFTLIKKNGRCCFKKSNRPPACAERPDWSARPASPWRRAGNGSPCCLCECVGAVGWSGFHSEK